ncbi:MAG: substrate-binding domain-containing protein [Dorea sp.]|nr:substrate-binding domain-containing protein [Dorea sp.]
MKKRLLALLMAATMVFTMAGCSVDGEKKADDTASSETTEATGNGAIGLAISTQNNPFFVTLAEGAEAAAKEAGVELYVVDASDDTAKQTSDVEDLISKNCSVIIVNPVDSDAIAPVVGDAMAAGIKVIAVDRAVNGVDIDCQIASDNVAGAAMATEYIVELLGEGAKVAELQGQTGASATIDRGQGFHNVADEKLDCVASQTAKFDRAEGMTVMENILQSNGDILGVFAHNDEMALGALEAIASSGKDIIVVGFDATDDALAAIKDGKMAATVAQQPDKMGATAIEVAIKLMNGESVEKSVPVEVTLVTE